MVVPRPDPPPDRYMITYILAYTHSTIHACIHSMEPCRPLFVSSCSCVGVWRGFGVWHGLTQAWLVPKQGPTRPGSVSLPTDLTRRRRRLRIVAVVESIRCVQFCRFEIASQEWLNIHASITSLPRPLPVPSSTIPFFHVASPSPAVLSPARISCTHTMHAYIRIPCTHTYAHLGRNKKTKTKTKRAGADE